ncbi:Sphingomyelin phosphodiesterase [Purpureocillium takamizusanense]|uniref:Sphingomyelin phosphodiesterase n=1 Tax=Purpureocillium takamizusanense TaxID=2060973 RepID=A0A9Q8QDV4_9HYPO|nr:Sphingomyelin phosphodiesterase [Purpureocillium takamizusanense]UNI17845.1 Sphingomyelin phosphodiesterase [Purpureocillium takamizusanense]
MLHTVARGLALCLAVGSLAPQGVAADAQHVERDRRSLAAGTWALETRQSLGDLKTCTGCKSILRMVKSILKEGNESFIGLAKHLCTSGTGYDAQYCNGTIEREAPPIADLCRKLDVDSKAAAEFCQTFLGVCESSPIDPWDVPFPSRRPCDQSRVKPSTKKPVQVIHYSDIHIDPLYVEGSSAKCDKPTCCRLFNSDEVPGKNKFPAGPNGDHNCDVPTTLEQSMYKAIKDMFPDAIFSLFTGDIIDHGLFNTSKEYNEQSITDAYTKMNGSVKLIYGTAGNHEAHPANIYNPKSVSNDTAWLYETLDGQWQRWIGKSDDARSMGAYSVKYPGGKLRVISLNTNMYYRFNFVLYQKLERDPNGQIAWLVDELDAAEAAGESVYILGHMPPGEHDCLRDQSNYLDQVFNRYQGTIKAMFFGHTHVDHFEITYSDYQNRNADNAAVVSYICPSLTPTSGMPSFRVYDVDPDTFAVLDATTYIANMSEPGFQSRSGPKWTKYYSAREVYGPTAKPPLAEGAELTPAFWHRVTDALEGNTDHFDAYMARKSRGWQADSKCRDDCMKQEICQLRAARSQDNCFKPKPGVHFSKRDDEHHHGHNRGEHDECGVSVTGEVLTAMAKREDLLQLLHETFVKVGATLEDEPEKPVERRAASDTASASKSAKESDCVAKTTASGTAAGSASGTASTVPSSTGGAAALGGAAMMAVGAAVMAL